MLKDSEIGSIAAIGPVADPPHSKYERLIAFAKQVPPATTVVAHPCDETSLRGAVEAAHLGIITPILVGPAAKISAVAQKHGIEIARYEIVDAPHSDAAAAKAVALIHEGKGELLMKGSLHTDELMREVTSSKTGLRTARRISHVFIMDVPTHADTLFITDAAGIVLGARVPIILTSRADSVRSRMASCAMAVLYAHARRSTAPVPAA